MKNFFDILKTVCILAHEEIPASFSETVEPYSELKEYIKDTVEEVCSKFPWTFRERKYSFDTVVGLREYELPDGLIPSNILENGVRIEGNNLPLYFMFHNDLDSEVLTTGKPYRYSVYSSRLILDPTPDDIYSVQIKYLTMNFAFDSTGTQEKANLQGENDVTILPDRYLKIIEWGAYALYRQNYKPDTKYKFAREKFAEYLLDIQRQDGYCGDSGPVIVLDDNIDPKTRMIRDFFRNKES